MELSSKSSVTTTWNLCTIGSVLACLIILLIFNKNEQIVNIWASTTSTPRLEIESELANSNPPVINSSPPPIATLVSPLLNHSSTISSPPRTIVANLSLEVSTLSAPPLANEVSPSIEVNTLSSPPLATMADPPLVVSTLSEPPLPAMASPSLVVSTLSEPPRANLASPSLEVSNLSEPPKPSVIPNPSNNISTSTTPNVDNNNVSDYANNNNNINNSNILVEPMKNKVVKKCNIYDGKWVYKADGKPSYMASQCPFMEEKMSCQRNKRPDMEFEKWLWKPNDCDIPLLNGTDMVERFKHKRVIFVGDSLNRNMWESLSCILYSNIPNASTKAHIHFEGAHSRTFLKVKDEYNFTVEFFWTPYLVEQNKNHSSGKKVLVLDRLSPNNESWIGADIMIFNSGMHWIQLPPKKGWDLYEYNGQLMDMPLHMAFKRGMKTWAKWVKKNVDPNKTTVFFRSISAEHLNKLKDQWCVGKTKPIMDESYVSNFPIKLIRSIEEVIKGMNSQVNYMNVTKMSRYRIDAHPSIYRYNDWKIRAENDLASLQATADCGHWCLPGVPDTWNRMLYVSLFFDLSL